MSHGHILIVDEQYERNHHISFLLRLASFKITLARTASEGINWVTSLHEESGRFDLILINHVDDGSDLLSLCDVANRVTGELAVLIIESHHPASMIATICSASCGRISTCRSAEAMQRVQQLLEMQSIKK